MNYASRFKHMKTFLKLLSICVFPCLSHGSFLTKDFFENLWLGESYIKISGHGMELVSQADQGSFANHGEWNFTTILSLDKANPRLYVALAPMIHSTTSGGKVRFQREAWYEDGVWIYSEYQVDDAGKPRSPKQIVIQDSPPTFLGNISRDSDYIGLTFIPWVYGIFGDLSLRDIESRIGSLDVELRQTESNSTLEIRNICNHSILNFNIGPGSLVRLEEVQMVANLCGRSFPIITEIKFYNSSLISELSSVFQIPHRYESRHFDEEGFVRLRREGMLSSVEVISSNYADAVFRRSKTLEGVIVDHVNRLRILPSGDVVEF